MFFKPKVYKDEGEQVALILKEKIESVGPQEFLANTEVYVEEGLQRIGIFK